MNSRNECVIVLPIYAAREENISGVTHTKLVETIKEKNPDATAFDTFEEVVEELKKTATADNVILVMGAGDVTEVTKKLF